MAMVPIPVWLESVFKERLNDVMLQAERRIHRSPDTQKLDEVLMQLKKELTFAQYQIFLQYDGLLTDDHTQKKELMYWEGLRDGMKFLKGLHHFISNDEGD